MSVFPVSVSAVTLLFSLEHLPVPLTASEITAAGGMLLDTDTNNTNYFKNDSHSKYSLLIITSAIC